MLFTIEKQYYFLFYFIILQFILLFHFLLVLFLLIIILFGGRGQNLPLCTIWRRWVFGVSIHITVFASWTWLTVTFL